MSKTDATPPKMRKTTMSDGAESTEKSKRELISAAQLLLEEHRITEANALASTGRIVFHSVHSVSRCTVRRRPVPSGKAREGSVRELERREHEGRLGQSQHRYVARQLERLDLELVGAELRRERVELDLGGRQV